MREVSEEQIVALVGGAPGQVATPRRDGKELGGELFARQRKMWQREGLPAYCPVCRRNWKFQWMSGAKWVCPMYDAQCWVYIRLNDLRMHPDGGVWWCDCGGNIGYPVHLCASGDPGFLNLEYCVRQSKKRVMDRQQNCDTNVGRLPTTTHQNLERGSSSK